MFNRSRLLFLMAFLAIALMALISGRPAEASGLFAITLTPSPTPTETPVPPTVTQPPPSATATLIVFPPGDTPTPTVPPGGGSEQEGEEEEEDPTRTPEPAILPDTGELPPLSGDPSRIAAIFLVGLAAGLGLGYLLRRRFAALFIGLLVLAVALVAKPALWSGQQLAAAPAAVEPVAAHAEAQGEAVSVVVDVPGAAAVQAQQAPDQAQAAASVLPAVAGAALSGAAAASRKPYASSEGAEQARAVGMPVAPEDAIWRVEIPALGVDAAVLKTPRRGLSWDITGIRDRVAWLEGTAAPSEEGNTVLAAHVTVRSIGKGPFHDLVRLKEGDLIRVHSGDQVYVYAVRELRVVKEEDVWITAPTPKAQLTLITCSGWDEEAASYTRRRAIVAQLLRVEPGLSTRLH